MTESAVRAVGPRNPTRRPKLNAGASEAASALSAALSAACRANETQFANYLTADNAAAFRALPVNQRTAFVSASRSQTIPASRLLPLTPRNTPCSAAKRRKAPWNITSGIRACHENLAFIPVTVLNLEDTEFGLVRENGAWRILSLGLVLLDIPQLAKQWDESDLPRAKRLPYKPFANSPARSEVTIAPGASCLNLSAVLDPRLPAKFLPNRPLW